MAEVLNNSIFKRVDLNYKANNTEHHTNEISETQLIVRRGQSFKVTVELMQQFNANLNPFSILATTGPHPSEELRTSASFSVPGSVGLSSSGKTGWKVELGNGSSLQLGILNLLITPPADAPIGEHVLVADHRNEKTQLAVLVLLFNPWCHEDSVFLNGDKKKREYVLNENGIIYRGSGNYISSLKWDFGQFEDDMVTICMKLLEWNNKHLEDPAKDVSARATPIYVGRTISAMINNLDDHGVLEGRWGGPYSDGFSPSHWVGSHAILKKWLTSNLQPVKYGQCWVFAAVMCSVMRFLGVPCRVVTNFQSAHDTDANLIIDTYYSDDGVTVLESNDSVWNFHVWVECWMKRPDLSVEGKFDGWQVLDPTPQEISDGIYCCGPAAVKAILKGETATNYDVPFVFAEVNADCVDWKINADGSKVRIWTDTKRVGRNISTKYVTSNKRWNITNTYKHKEGSKKERAVFEYACTRDYSKEDEEEEEEEEEEDEEEEGEEEEEEEVEEEEEEEGVTPKPQLSLRFEEVSKPENGKDVSLNLVVHSKSTVAIPLTINISVQAMKYNGTPAAKIQSEKKDETLQPNKDLSIPILIPFSTYNQPMLNAETMKIVALVSEKLSPDNMFMAEDDVVLVDPPISLKVDGVLRLNRMLEGELVFMNPVQQTLKKCTLSVSGSGLLKDDLNCSLPDIKPNHRIIVRFKFIPYKPGRKTLLADFDCSVFRDIKASCKVNVLPPSFTIPGNFSV